MSQAERISRIHFLLHTKGCFTVAEMKEDFEVSRATVMRDIEFMRDRLFAPIRYRPDTNTYVLEEERDGDGLYRPKQIGIPGMWIKSNEAYALLTLINVLGKVDPGMLTPYVSPLRRLLKNVLSGCNIPMKGFHKKVVVDLPNLRSGNQSVVTVIGRGLADEVQVTVVWRDERGENRNETVSMQRFILGLNGWEAEFLCEKEEFCQRIPVHRFSAATLTKSPARLLPEFRSDPKEDWKALARLYQGNLEMGNDCAIKQLDII